MFCLMPVTWQLEMAKKTRCHLWWHWQCCTTIVLNSSFQREWIVAEAVGKVWHSRKEKVHTIVHSLRQAQQWPLPCSYKACVLKRNYCFNKDVLSKPVQFLSQFLQIFNNVGGSPQACQGAPGTGMDRYLQENKESKTFNALCYGLRRTSNVGR